MDERTDDMILSILFALLTIFVALGTTKYPLPPRYGRLPAWVKQFLTNLVLYLALLDKGVVPIQN